MNSIESQIEDINNQINQLTFKKLELEMKLDESKRNEELKLLQDDLTNITCCEETFHSKKAYSRHIISQKHKLYTNEPKFRCQLCNIYIFDGVWSLAELEKDPIKMLNSNYKKHMEYNCERLCPKCGYNYQGSRYKKQNHKCNAIVKIKKKPWQGPVDVKKYNEIKAEKKQKIIEKKEKAFIPEVIKKLESKSFVKCLNGKDYIINTRNNKVILGCKQVGTWNAITETITFKEKPLEPVKEILIEPDEPDDIPVITSDSETSSSEIETESWKYNGYKYEIDNRNNVYDENGEKIGKKYGEQLVKII
tara:strand:+ start:3998 stop:4915 length:918 start_codon:yes stop_codon:yes gene_type:complete